MGPVRLSAAENGFEDHRVPFDLVVRPEEKRTGRHGNRRAEGANGEVKIFDV